MSETTLFQDNSLSFQEVLKIIPQRQPMIFIDKIISMDTDYLIALKNISGNEPFFEGHFPDTKIFPGVLLIESMAQATIVLFNHTEPNINEKGLPVLYHTDIKFKEIVVPGDQLIIRIDMIKKVKESAIIEARATVEENEVAKGKLSFTFKKDKGGI